MISTPRVSVIVATHNYGRFLAESVGSALTQDRVDLEVIVVDDGSTDTTEAVMGRLCSDQRVRLLRQEHRGPGAARNRALAMSSSPHVAMLDADDAWMPDKLFRQLAVLEADPAIGLVYTDSLVIHADGRPQRRHFGAASGHRPRVGWVLPELAMSNFISTSTVVVRRPLLDEVGAYDESLQVCEDWDLWLRMAARAPLAFVDAPLAQIRRHGANTHLQGDLMARDSFRVLERIPRYAGDWRRLGPRTRSRAYAAAHRRAAISLFLSGEPLRAVPHIGRAIACDPRGVSAADARLAGRCLAALPSRFLSRAEHPD
jgi:Glycosyl transferase family 2